jgi:hypothetical protein
MLVGLGIIVLGLFLWIMWSTAPYTVDSRLELPVAPERVIERVILAASADGRFDIAPAATAVQLSRKINQVWPIVVAVLAFPFGLLALIARTTERATIVASPVPGGSVVVLRGKFARKLFDRIEAELTALRSAAIGSVDLDRP